ncbi:MAG: WecB/TagA/CpsF family glycosyltransferase [Alphaproteobacteria bacterium]|nr:WecB/TagA/CpsF family glycosyltransferase [Alphaproteobacteria bacterium]
MPETKLLGLRLADMDVPAAAAALASRAGDAPFAYVMTPNADNFVRISRDPALRAIYERALIRLLDSRVVARAARLLGLAPPAVAPGSDLTAELLRHHLAPGERVAIVGLRPTYLVSLITACGITPPFHHDPPMGFERDPSAMRAAVEFVLAHPARFVFLAVGSPRQEMLADAIRATGRATGLGLCVGASLDFLAGASCRAPRWMQRAGLEWLHRLGSDPKRLARRYLVEDPPIFRLLLRERLTRRV